MFSEQIKERDMINIAKFFCFLGLIVTHSFIFGREEVNDWFFWRENFWVLKMATSLNVCLLYLAFFSFGNQNQLLEVDQRLGSSDRPVKYAYLLMALENVISLFTYNDYKSFLSGLPLTSVALSFLWIVIFWKKNRNFVFLSSLFIYLITARLVPAVHGFERVVAGLPFRYLVIMGVTQFSLYLLFVVFVLWEVLPFNSTAKKNILMLFLTLVLYRLSSQEFAAFHYFLPRIFLGSKDSPIFYPFLVWNPLFVSSFALYFIFKSDFINKFKRKKIMILFSSLTCMTYFYWFDFFNMFNFNYDPKEIGWDLYKFSRVDLGDCFFQMLPLTSLLFFSYQLRFVFYKIKGLGNVIRAISDSILYIYLAIILCGTLPSRIWPGSFPLYGQLLLQLAFYFLLSVIVASVHRWITNHKIKLKLVKRIAIDIPIR